MIKEFLYTKFAEKHIIPLRKQVCDLVNKDSRVIDIGCGNGGLLRMLSGKIKHGLGIETNSYWIKFAKKENERLGIDNLKFIKTDHLINFYEKFDYSILMFVLHSLDYGLQQYMLESSRIISDKIIIVDFANPNNKKQKLLLNFDEFIAGHYKNFRSYVRNSGMEPMLDNKKVVKKLDTSNELYKIWVYEDNTKIV